MEGLIFANSVAKSKETTMFSSERFARLIDSSSLAEAVKILVEANYGDGAVVEDPTDFELILREEERVLRDFVTFVNRDAEGFECFFLQKDYQNIKAIIKCGYQGEDPTRMLLNGGLLSPETLKEELATDTPRINQYADSAIKEIRAYDGIEKSPRIIDTLIDKAMYKDICARISNKKTDKYVKQYFVSYIDCTNICSYVRCVRIGGAAAFFESNFIEGGKLDYSYFASKYPDIEALKSAVEYSDYKALAEKMEVASMTEFDTMRDNLLLDVFKSNRNDMFSVAPMIGYYLGKLTEISALRIALVCIKNGVPKNEIEKRLRKMYA
ncbi:MAG: V-type ATPase subunit [Bacillota bacterium]